VSYIKCGIAEAGLSFSRANVMEAFLTEDDFYRFSGDTNGNLG
jgi:hypothetical protein